jgi:hypothetical protein
MTVSDLTQPANTFTTSFTINIPSIVGGNSAFIGFTGGMGWPDGDPGDIELDIIPLPEL